MGGEPLKTVGAFECNHDMDMEKTLTNVLQTSPDVHPHRCSVFGADGAWCTSDDDVQTFADSAPTSQERPGRSRRRGGLG